MKILLINASPHGEASHGYRFAAEIVGMLREHAAAAASAIKMIVRDLAAAPLPPVSRDYARAITSRMPDKSQFDISEQLIGEIETTDALIINTPMHNFTVPAALKLWIDYTLRIERTFAATPEGKVGRMHDRPTIVIVGSGGVHNGEHARQPDFLTPYLRYALGSIGVHNLEFLLLQGLVMGEATIAEALAAARNQLTGCSVFASLAAQAAGSASVAARTAAQCA
ncbi:FMN-dependent NADH-azoreductase [Paraburkholderia sp. BR13439]|uniref:FMN-dependent NADH-azoreductase n=1 Tax=Paraburkholderia TaxID=1822464 RepID=UPI0034CD5CCF